MITESHDLGAAVAEGTFLGQLPAELRARLLATAQVVEVPNGGMILSSSEAGDRVGIVIRGIARTFLTSGDGRRLSVRFARAGDTIESITATRAALGSQAVTDCSILRLDAAVLGALIVEDGRVGMTLLVEIARRLIDTYATLAANTFGTMRERVARQLLDVATEDSSGDGSIAPLTQQGLADGVGTVREVVARVLHDLREAGLVRTEAGRIEIMDPDGLATIVGRLSPYEGRQDPLDWATPRVDQ